MRKTQLKECVITFALCLFSGLCVVAADLATRPAVSYEERRQRQEAAELRVLELEREVSDLKFRLDQQRRDAVRPIPPAAEFPDDRIPPQNLPVPARP